MNPDFQTKAKSSRTILDFFASLKLTVWLMGLSMLLILLGTLEQVHWGVWHVQKEYFSAWYCLYPINPTAAIRIPLPGGFLLGGLLVLNLIFAHVRHFKKGIKHAGITMIHSGLILLLVGGFVTAAYQEESAMVIPENESRNFTEAFREFELAVIQHRQMDQVTVVPDGYMMMAGLSGAA